jgi:hypothetical protein
MFKFKGSMFKIQMRTSDGGRNPLFHPFFTPGGVGFFEHERWINACLRQNLVDHFPFHVGQSKVAAREAVCQLEVIQA